jgi:hypothetical protein
MILECIILILSNIHNDILLNNFENFDIFLQNLMNASKNYTNYAVKQDISYKILPKYNYLKSLHNKNTINNKYHNIYYKSLNYKTLKI